MKHRGLSYRRVEWVTPRYLKELSEEGHTMTLAQVRIFLGKDEAQAQLDEDEAAERSYMEALEAYNARKAAGELADGEKEPEREYRENSECVTQWWYLLPVKASLSHQPPPLQVL